MPVVRRPWLATVVLAALAASAQAQQNPADLASMSLEQLLDLEVVTASRFDQKANRAPSAVRIISAEEIRAHGWRTLAEALESLPGLYLSDSGLYTYLGARGQLHAGDYDTRFLLLVDGHRINDPVYSQSPVGSEFPLDMALVQRIEYVPGPGSAVYGSNAFFGVINVLTKLPGPPGEGELALTGGNYGTHAARASLSTGDAAGRTLLSASQSHSRGRDFHFQEFAEADSAGMARGQDDERTRRLFVRHTAGDLALLALAGDRRKEDPVAPYGQSFGIPGAGVQDRWAVLGLQYGRALSAATRWQAQLDLIDYRYIGDYAYGDSPTVINRDVSSGRSLVLGSRLVTTAFAGHIMAVGLEAQWDRAVEQLNYDVEPYASYLQSRENIANIGAFVTDEIALGGDWLLNAGLRLDHDDVGTVRLSPRLALISTPAGGTTFKAIVGKAFRSPNAYERFYGIDTEDGAQLLNPDIRAESIQTLELYFSRNLGSRSRAELSLFDYRLHHLITLVGEEDLLTLDNAGSASSTGAEVAFFHRWDQGAVVRSSYSYSRVRQSSPSTPLNAPRGIGKVSATLPLAHGLSAAASALYMSQRATRLGTAGRHTTVNANLLWEPVGAPWALSAGVRNLLDQAYADPVGPEFIQDAIPRRGREYRVELTWRF
ncbi:iron complex outermembrane recepter protein [Pseudoxanthomonas wuyuanensis]|uniref:Iron complex outermembrane recepter protein n=1 Tax=Pseudoxanthomonas wuyuanensis TaxID=1073196 RepID=A0A286DD64_9GAMM|nr:iron complex outermembrane recepter protein [Pseudoxanthomonas wuyuanensis]